MAESAFTLEHDHSVLGHTTDTEADYGTALCWAENAVGAQKAPCAFREDGRRSRQVVTNRPFRDTYTVILAYTPISELNLDMIKRF